jgi:hypothetical protein
MDESKLGLQKEVSEIFTGIQIPKKNAAGPDASSTAPASPITPHTQVAPAATPAPATPPARVITPAIVTTSTTVIPAVTAPASTVPAPVATPANIVTPKPAVVSPKPFTIQEPPTQATSQPTRQVVYEPPKPRQTTFEPSTPASLPISAPAKQSKSEFVIKQPKDSPLLKIIDKVKAKMLNSKHGTASSRQKMMLLLSPVLAIVLLFVVVNAVKTSPGTSVEPSNKATAAVVAPVLGSKISWEIPQPIPANLRNPMVFGAVSTSGKGTAEGPVVKGIVYSEDNPSAIVGDRIVSAGDTVAGATVVKINPDSVDFTVGDKKWSQKVEH